MSRTRVGSARPHARPVAPGRGPTPRGLAMRALLQVEGGERANVVVPDLLANAGLAERDRGFVTNLVYGTVRMRRACDWLVDGHLRRSVSDDVRAALRLGAFQLLVLGTPSHAAVSATVAEVDGPARGLVNAVLRRVAEQIAAARSPDHIGSPPDPVRLNWPSDGVRLSYPDWIVAELTDALGSEDALGALEQMNQPAQATPRGDGYIQDLASQWVVQAVLGTGEGGGAGRVLDLCAAPGGKATGLARGIGDGELARGSGDGELARGSGGGELAAAKRGGVAPDLVVAGDSDWDRTALLATNARRLGTDSVVPVVLDGRQAPFPACSFDRVLVDAPCSGLGVLRRRPDARWRVQPQDVARLAALQRQLLEEALVLVRPGGLVAYSVCTLTEAETLGIDGWLASAHPEAGALPPAVGPGWERCGRGVRVLPQAAGTDGMFLLTLRRLG